MQKTIDNLIWLRENSGAYIHADLIFGLPGESLESFADGFNQLVALDPHEIQVGLLKRLRGTPINRHTAAFNMRYQTQPPYRILQTGLIDYQTMQRMVRFARYWDLVGNSGRFKNVLPFLLGSDPFRQFLQLSDWLHDTTGRTHRIALARLFLLIKQWAEDAGNCAGQWRSALDEDCRGAGFDLSVLSDPVTTKPGPGHGNAENCDNQKTSEKRQIVQPTANTDRQSRHKRRGQTSVV